MNIALMSTHRSSVEERILATVHERANWVIEYSRHASATAQHVPLWPSAARTYTHKQTITHKATALAGLERCPQYAISLLGLEAEQVVPSLREAFAPLLCRRRSLHLYLLRLIGVCRSLLILRRRLV